MKRLFGYSKGQVAVVYTLAVVALVGAVAFGTDVAVMYMNWENLQKSVDSAALAGANYLYNVNSSLASSTATTYAESNGVQSSELTTSVASDRSSITVSAQRTVPYYFAKVLGLSSQLVQVTATAGAPNNPTCIGVCNVDGTPATSSPGTYGTTTGEYGIIPVGLQYNTTYTADGSVLLTMGGTGNNGTWGPGNWGSLALGAPGGNMLRSNFADGYSGPVSVGQWVNTATGIKSGPVSQGLQDRINAGLAADPTGTYASHTWNDPRVGIIPLVNWTNINGASAVEIMGFAAVWLDSVNGGQINAHFITQVAANAYGNTSSYNEGVHGQPILIK
jgi:Flp pilus assembly protein TadG